MNLSKKLTLAIDAVSYIKNRIKPSSTGTIAQEIGTTTFFLEQIMGQLKNGGIVTAKRGPGGGFFVDSLRPPITVFDLAKALDCLPDTPKADGSIVDQLQTKIMDAVLNTVI